MLKKKTVVVTPESRIQGAELHVRAQQDHFFKMIEEVQWAMKERSEAMEEMSYEIASLEAKLAEKRKWVQMAQDQNTADEGFIKKINGLLGN